MTALAGYAGGLKTDSDPVVKSNKDRVCYHNPLMQADYGQLGHAEVVGLKIPSNKYKEFAKEYIKLFDKKGDRPDKGDRGAEYRSLVGLPGGVKSPLM